MTKQKTVGDLLRDARAEKDLGLRAAAEKAGISHGYLGAIEREDATMPEETIKKLSKALDIDFDVLMGAAGRFPDDLQRIYRRFPRRVRMAIVKIKSKGA